MSDIAPTLPPSGGSLPPEGALRLRPGEAGSAAPAGEDCPLRSSLRVVCPQGPLRLRPGKAISAAGTNLKRGPL